jgi:hypothetical protein
MTRSNGNRPSEGGCEKVTHVNSLSFQQLEGMSRRLLPTWHERYSINVPDVSPSFNFPFRDDVIPYFPGKSSHRDTKVTKTRVLIVHIYYACHRRIFQLRIPASSRPKTSNGYSRFDLLTMTQCSPTPLSFLNVG